MRIILGNGLKDCEMPLTVSFTNATQWGVPTLFDGIGGGAAYELEVSCEGSVLLKGHFSTLPQ